MDKELESQSACAISDLSVLPDGSDAVAVIHRLVAELKRLSEAEGEAEHLRMQIGYIATELMVRGDPRSLPEIVETAAKATAPTRSEQK